MATVYEPCGDAACDANVAAHALPDVGTSVVVTEPYDTRSPEDDETVRVAAGARGVVLGFVAAWHDVHVRLDDGVEVWLVPDVLDWDTEVTIGWTKSDHSIGYSSFSDGYQPGAEQHTLTVHVEVPDDANITAAVDAIAEAAFAATNHPNPEILTGFAKQIYDGVRASGYTGRQAHYSLSVGDTVTVGEVTLACANLGWQRVVFAI